MSLNCLITRISLQDVIRDDTDPPDPVPGDLQMAMKSCQFPLTVRRTRTCGHQFKTSCTSAFRFLTDPSLLPKCEVRQN